MKDASHVQTQVSVQVPEPVAPFQQNLGGTLISF